MQRLFYPLIVLFSLTSCSPDEDSTLSDKQVLNRPQTNYRGLPEVYPENRSNMYDITGSLYYRISENYLTSNIATPSISQTIVNTENLANADSAFLAIKSTSYLSPTEEQLEYLLNVNIPVIEKVGRLPISSPAKASFLGFLDRLISYHKSGELAMTIHTFIVGYEAAVLAGSQLDAFDKQVILSATSVSRYAVHFANTHRKRKPRDRDWEISYSCIIAAALGGSRNTAEAITLSVDSAMLQNVEY